jgi:hypothetical protein
VKLFTSGNGNFIRRMIEEKFKENNNVDLKNGDDNGLFIIISLFSILFEKYVEYHSDNNFDNNQGKVVMKLILLIGICYFNFYYKENCPSHFIIILDSLEEIKRNYFIDNNKELFDKCQESAKHITNYIKSKKYNSYENRLYGYHTSLSSSLFGYEVLERIVENSDNKNVVELSFSTDTEINTILQFLLNNPYFQSIYFPAHRFFNITIESYNLFIYKKKCFDYIFHDKRFNFCILF